MKTFIFIILCAVNPAWAIAWAGISILIVIADVATAAFSKAPEQPPMTAEEQSKAEFDAELDYYCRRWAADEYDY